MLRNIIQTFGNCFKIPELKSRILFTIAVLAICRLISMTPIPGLDGQVLSQFFEDLARRAARGGDAGGSLLGMYSMFTGGALEHCAVGSLGIMPYISASIIIQLLTAVIPTLTKLAREEGGRTKLIQYGRYLTVLLCIGQGFFMALGWENPGSVFGGGSFPGKLVLYENLIWYRIQTTIILTTGTLLLMWLGEQITERGIGNGISLLISIGILARLPQAFVGISDMFLNRGAEAGAAGFHPFYLIALVLLLLGVVAGVIAVTQAQRKVPVHYAQRAVGKKIVSGGTSYMPLKVNYPGVMPIIFAQALLMFPERLLHFAGTSFNLPLLSNIANYLSEGKILYIFLFGLMILFFSFFWVSTQFNELQIADDLKKHGGYIPGVFLHHAMTRITFAGAMFLTLIAVVPILLNREMRIPFQVATFFGGTSLLIIVGVMLDTLRQLESQLQMRHYDGFLKKGRLRGRNS
jgi:preprotein translocase subunit SecY